MKIVPDILPSEFGLVVLTLALILAIAPYAAGHDFGIFKIPAFNSRALSFLKIGGPLALGAGVLLHIALPLPATGCEEPVYEMVTDAVACGTVEEEYVITPARPQTCRHVSFGQEGWRYTEESTGSSGWMRGGFSQPDWCRRLIANFLSSRSIDSKHEATSLRSSEQARWTGTFGRIREYNYNCTVKVSWEPIYAEGTDDNICGMTSAVLGQRRVPATCQKQIGTRKVDCEK